YSMGLPGPYDADRPNAAVLISTEAYTDGNGYLDINGLSTTLAHELGHYLGMYHTSERAGNTHDPIADSPECSQDEFSCSEEYTQNLMSSGGGAARWRFTEGQGVVMRRHPLCQAS